MPPCLHVYTLPLLCLLTACGGGSNDSEEPVIPKPETTGHITTSGDQILSASETPFLLRGVNLQYGDNPTTARPAIHAIALTGANAVRLQLRATTTAEQLRLALDDIIAHGMVAMPMYWEEDITCHSDVAIFNNAITTLWLGRWKSVLQDERYRGKIMLNIANEWGSSQDYDSYITTYQQAIRALRKEGLHMPLVIDGADCGQDANSFLQGRGNQLLTQDVDKNLIFSLHAYYDNWRTSSQIASILTQYQTAQMPLIIGEFGDDEFQREQQHNVDHHALMQVTAEQNIGWLAWSWKGNGSGYEVLDMSIRYSPADLTRRGEDIVYGNHGLQATSKPIQ